MIVDGVAVDCNDCPCGNCKAVAVVRYWKQPAWFTGSIEDFREGRGALGPRQGDVDEPDPEKAFVRNWRAG